MRILITGGAGFVGSHTVDELSKKNHSIIVVDNFSTGREDNVHISPRVVVIRMDINDERKLDKLFDTARPEAILHLAAQSAISTSWKNPKKDARVNIIGTLNLLELAGKYDVEKFVFSSTSAVYDARPTGFSGTSEERTKCNPNTPYGISKLAAEHYIRSMFDNHIILRYGNIYGPRQVPIGENQIIPHIFRHFLYGDEFNLIYNGKQKRDFVFVKDIARANVIAIESNATGTFNVASGKSVSVNDILACFENVYEIWGYKWNRSENIDSRGSVYMDVRKARRELGWKAEVGIEDGIRMTADWWECQK